MKKTIKVTQENINKSIDILSKNENKYKRSSCCPVALALKEEFPERYIQVRGAYVDIDFNDLSLPKFIVDWICNFDIYSLNPNSKCRTPLPVKFVIDV